MKNINKIISAIICIMMIATVIPFTVSAALPIGFGEVGINNTLHVNEKNWFAKAVQWAVEKGVTGGTSATTFAPNSAVTREQLATFFMAYAKS